MKAYKELSEEIGKSKLFQASSLPGTEASRAGKMGVRTRTRGRRNWVETVAGREHLITRRLCQAACDGTYEEVLELIRRGADVKRADSKGRTPLHFASCRGDANTVKLLLSHGARVNQRDCNGNTPLHLASCTHHVGVVTALLNAGTDVTATDFRGVTPLHLALSRLRIVGEVEGERGGGEMGGEGGGGEVEGEGGSGEVEGERGSGEVVKGREKVGGATSALTRKKEISQIVELIRTYLRVTDGSRGEEEELERLAGRLTISETPQQVDEVQDLLHSFTSLSLQRRDKS